MTKTSWARCTPNYKQEAVRLLGGVARCGYGANTGRGRPDAVALNTGFCLTCGV